MKDDSINTLIDTACKEMKDIFLEAGVDIEKLPKQEWWTKQPGTASELTKDEESRLMNKIYLQLLSGKDCE